MPPLALPANWEEVITNGDKVDKCLNLIRTTLPNRFNYENLDRRKAMFKMVARKNSAGFWVPGLRIFQRIIPPNVADPLVPEIDIAVLFFLRLAVNNPNQAASPPDAYCMTVGVVGSGPHAVTAVTLYSEVRAVCQAVQTEPGGSRIEIANAYTLPQDLPNSDGARVLYDAFVAHSHADPHTPPNPGEISGAPDVILPSPVWPVAPDNTMQSYLVSP